MDNLSAEELSELWLYVGVGIICYGIMSGMFIYLLCNILKWHNILYALIVGLVFCLSMVGYSIVKVIKILKTNHG